MLTLCYVTLSLKDDELCYYPVNIIKYVLGLVNMNAMSQGFTDPVRIMFENREPYQFGPKI
jgi:hypothetical protein